MLEALWAHGKASIREIQEAFPEPRPAYTTVQTTVYRLEAKKALRRLRKIGNAHIFEPSWNATPRAIGCSTKSSASSGPGAAHDGAAGRSREVDP